VGYKRGMVWRGVVVELSGRREGRAMKLYSEVGLTSCVRAVLRQPSISALGPGRPDSSSRSGWGVGVDFEI
jgi:hypothetical protein